MNDAPVEMEPSNKYIQSFKFINENFNKWYSDSKLSLDSEELGDYILKNIKDITHQ